ncbi:hypothetical protein L9F63_022977, partial [Diploptera punctata]
FQPTNKDLNRTRRCNLKYRVISGFFPLNDGKNQFPVKLLINEAMGIIEDKFQKVCVVPKIPENIIPRTIPLY